ncbi:MAG TPA: amino acid permease [Bryobacteraceae bacterium]|nr:amino acid permease [Bryobacteraceae bacterium]
MGLAGAVAIVVGTVIGSGIFLVPKAMILQVGSPSIVFAVWIFGGILTLFGALTYAELAAAMPEAGGEYVYLREAYGPFFGFLYGWTQTWVAKAASVATLATGFYLYLANFFPALERPLWVGDGGWLEIRIGQLLAILVILALGVLNYFGVKVGGSVQVIVTGLKVAMIVGIVVAALVSGQGQGANFGTSINAPGGFSGFFVALVAVLWAYDGWNNVNMVASEIKNPQRNLPVALIAGTVLVIAVYLATNLAYFYVLSASDVAASDRVAAEMMRRVFGQSGASLVSLAAMISIFAALNGSLLSGSRVPYALARDGLFLKTIAYVHPRYATPAHAILLLSVWSSVITLSGRYDQLYTLVIFPSWILYTMAAASVLVLRRRRPDMPRPYRTIGYPLVPIFFVIVALTLLFNTLRESPRESGIGLVLIAAGVPFYFHWSKRTAKFATKELKTH